MRKIDKIFSEDELTYDKVASFIEKKDREELYKILFRINKFDTETQKRICKEIIINTDDERMIDKSCMEIITFIKYDYEYYREILTVIIEKNICTTWSNVIKDKLIEDGKITMQYVFEDFSKEVPENIDFDIVIIQSFIEKYDEKHIEDLQLKKRHGLIVCERINDILTINIENILKFHFYFENKFKFSKNEVENILAPVFFNYPYVCKTFVEKHKENIENSKSAKYLLKRIAKFDKEEKIKYSMKIFHPDRARINQYRKYQLKQNKEINKKANEQSIFMNLCKKNTILYGKRCGVTVMTNNEMKISVSELHELRYECPYPLQYIVDPVDYNIRIATLKQRGKEK